MNMQALQQDTLLKGGAYRIEKILSQSDLEITYLSDKFGDNRNVVVTEFFVKDICRREKNNSVAYDSEDVATMRDKFKSDALDRLNKGILEVFEENNTAYYVKYEDDGAIIIHDDSSESDNLNQDDKKDAAKPSLLKKLKWPLILVAVIGAGAAFFVSSEPPVEIETTTVNSEKKVETKTVETKKEESVKVEKESATFAPIMEKLRKAKKDAEAIPGVSQHKVLTQLSNVKDEFEKVKSKLTADEQDRYHKAFQEVIEIVKKRS